ncbi:MAG TPA: hypothetical protein VIT41_07305 [Microlunatus sp.]
MSALTAPPRTRTALADLVRVDGRVKVEGTAAYAGDVSTASMAYCEVGQSTVVRGVVTGIDSARAEARPGVLLVLTHENAPRLVDVEDAELVVRQTAAVGYRGQIVAAVVADTPRAHASQCGTPRDGVRARRLPLTNRRLRQLTSCGVAPAPSP